MTETPTQYARRRASELGFDWIELISRRRAVRFVDARSEIMLELYRDFGVTTTRIGLIMGGRDHSVVHNALKKMGLKFGRRTKVPPEVRPLIARLSADGLTNVQIARRLTQDGAPVTRDLVWHALHRQTKSPEDRRRHEEGYLERKRRRREEVREELRKRRSLSRSGRRRLSLEQSKEV